MVIREIVLSTHRIDSSDYDALSVIERGPDDPAARKVKIWIRPDGLWYRSVATSRIVHVPYLDMTGHEILEAHARAQVDPEFDERETGVEDD